MKTIVDIRTFAVEQAVKVMGPGTANKDIVEKAREIESYIIKDVDMSYSEENFILSDVLNFIENMISKQETEVKAEEVKPAKDRK